MSPEAIYEAAYDNNVAGIRAAIAADADVNAQHPRAGTLPLQLACSADALDAIAELLKAGADPARKFTRASRSDPSKIFKDHTPLMYAESREAAQLLLDAGADVDAADGKGWTALVYAVNARNAALVDYLIERGARTDVRAWFAGRHCSLAEFLDEKQALYVLASQTSAGEKGERELAELALVRKLLAP